VRILRVLERSLAWPHHDATWVRGKTGTKSEKHLIGKPVPRWTFRLVSTSSVGKGRVPCFLLIPPTGFYRTDSPWYSQAEALVPAILNLDKDRDSGFLVGTPRRC